jgi:hypothetical protein
MAKKKIEPTKVEPTHISFETLRKIHQYDISNMKKDYPTCFNGVVSIKKYKVTIEEVIEPQEVYAERLQKLWDECDNYHHWTPIKEAAERIGYTLINVR